MIIGVRCYRPDDTAQEVAAQEVAAQEDAAQEDAAQVRREATGAG